MLLHYYSHGVLPVAFKLSMVERATNSFDAKQAHMLNFAEICCVGVLVDGALTFGRGPVRLPGAK